MKTKGLAFFILSILLTISSKAQTTTISYQGRVSAGGTNFSGTGLFKFALVTSTNTSQQARATAQRSGQFVTAYSVTSGGSGYATAPAVTVFGGGGSGATVYATISSGAVTSVVADSAGSGYTSTPTVYIAPPSATAVITGSYWSNDGSSVNGSEPSAAVSVIVNDGLFNVVLGDTSQPNMLPMNASLFTQTNLQLRIWFNDGVHGSVALDPLQPLVPAPYANFANIANTASTAGFATTATTATTANNVPSSGLSGTYNNALTLNNSANVFSGNGANLTALNASQLSSGQVPIAVLNNTWKISGNIGANPADGVFIGTSDNYPVEFKANGERVLRIEPTTVTTNNDAVNSPNIIAGASGNWVSNGVVGATIGGGGAAAYQGASNVFNTVSADFGTVSGGSSNSVSGLYSTVGGGFQNSAAGRYSSIASGTGNVTLADNATVGGGQQNLSAQRFSTVAGGYFNIASNYAATVGGGEENVVLGNYATVAGGFINSASGTSSVVAGGQQNTASAYESTISGGALNTASANSATIAGGDQNNIPSTGANATIGGGGANVASGFYATVPGGIYNTAAGAESFAAGGYAQALHTGSFVWSDESTAGTYYTSTGNNQFSVKAAGGIRFAGDLAFTGGNAYHNISMPGGNSTGYIYGAYTALGDGMHLGYNYYYDSGGAGHLINSGGGTSRISAGYGEVDIAVGGVNVSPNTTRLVANTSGVTVYGTFNNSSDRNLKENFGEVSPATILDKVSELPVTTWNYKADPKTRHIGPVAQDFYSTFNIGTDDKHIAPIDEGGVALAAIKGLNVKLSDELKRRDAENAELKNRLEKVEQQLATVLENMRSKTSQ